MARKDNRPRTIGASAETHPWLATRNACLLIACLSVLGGVVWNYESIYDSGAPSVVPLRHMRKIRQESKNSKNEVPHLDTKASLRNQGVHEIMRAQLLSLGLNSGEDSEFNRLVTQVAGSMLKDEVSVVLKDHVTLSGEPRVKDVILKQTSDSMPSGPRDASGAMLWDASSVLATLLTEDTELMRANMAVFGRSIREIIEGQRVLELGAGLGLASIAGLYRGTSLQYVSSASLGCMLCLRRSSQDPDNRWGRGCD